MATLLSDILTIDWLKSTYLQGINLTDAQGVALPDIVYTEAIQSAVRHIEGMLDISILPVSVKNERQDLHRIDRLTFWMKGTYRKPFMSVDSMRLRLGNIQILSLPKSWIYELAPDYGTFNVIPTMDQLMIGTHAMQVLMAYNGDNMPGALELDYKAGMWVLEGTVTVPAGQKTFTAPIGQTLLTSEYTVQYSLVNPALADAGIKVSTASQGNDSFDLSLSSLPTQNLQVRWVLSTMPSDLKAIIGLWASIQPLNVAGTTLVGPGISTKSVSIDGLSQSIGTTANSAKHAYSNRVDAHTALFDKMMPYVRARYTGPLMSIT